jgi:hypothetical protein
MRKRRTDRQTDNAKLKRILLAIFFGKGGKNKPNFEEFYVLGYNVV